MDPAAEQAVETAAEQAAETAAEQANATETASHPGNPAAEHADESAAAENKATDDELVLTGGFIQKNLNGNKSIYVEREIGQRPVLAFGNSGSDTSMMNYAIDSRNPYRAEAYMVVADDNVCEWGTQDWEEKSKDYIAKGFPSDLHERRLCCNLS